MTIMNQYTNCVYPTFLKSLDKPSLSIPSFFILFGGEDYHYVDNTQDSSLEIAGCHYRTDFIKEFCKVSFIFDQISLQELLTIIRCQKKILVAVNSFEFSEDKLNYKKNVGEHWLLLTQAKDGMIYFSDNLRSGTITSAQLQKMNWNKEKPFNFITAKPTSTTYLKNMQKQNLDRIIFELNRREQLQVMKESEMFFKRIESYLKEICSRPNPQRLVDIMAFARQLTKPNSILFAKYMESEFLRKTKNGVAFRSIYLDWVGTVKMLEEVALNKKKVSEILIKLESNRVKENKTILRMMQND